jgi:uncharacterized protein DUF2550
MIFAALIALGVPLIIVVAFAAVVLKRRRWLKKQPGVFAGVIRVGSSDGGEPKWKRGSGRWVRDILVWSKAPLLLGTQLIPVDGVLGERETKAGEVKRLGDHPVAVEFATAGGKIEVATKAEQRVLVTGPFTKVSTPAPLATAPAEPEDGRPQPAVRGA